MLNIGLHSYGFMDSAFRWLMVFVASQLVLMGLGMLPLQYWRSFRGTAAAGGSSEPPAGGKPRVSPV
jgi:hypothetical protein